MATMTTQMVASSVTGAPLPDLEANREEEGPCGERTLWTRLWQGMAGASIVVNILSMAIEGSSVAIVAGIFAVLVGPIVIVRQFKLQNTDSKCLKYLS